MKAAERRHMDAVVDLGCVICGGPALIHHVQRTRRRPGDSTRIGRDNMLVLPLCFGHHDDRMPDGLHHAEAEWVAQHGTQAYWLDRVDQMLGGTE